MTTKLTSDRAAAVDTAYHWQRIDSHTPLGAKLLLINKHAGTCTIGALGGKDSWFTHWAPLPTFQKDSE
jgi:hypothetical protein